MRYYLLIVGLCLTGFGLKLMYQRVRFLCRSRKTYGRFDDWKEIPRLNYREVDYFAEVIFTASDGTQHRVASDTGTSSRVRQKPEAPEQRPIPVRYDPDNPDDAHVATLFNLWAPSLAFLILGSVAIFAFFHGAR